MSILNTLNKQVRGYFKYPTKRCYGYRHENNSHVSALTHSTSNLSHDSPLVPYVPSVTSSVYSVMVGSPPKTTFPVEVGIGPPSQEP